MYRWLHRNQILGPYLRAYTEKTGVTLGYKLWTITFLWVTIVFSAFFGVEILWVRWMLMGIALAVTLHVATLKTKAADTTEPIAPPILDPQESEQ